METNVPLRREAEIGANRTSLDLEYKIGGQFSRGLLHDESSTFVLLIRCTDLAEEKE